MEATFIYTAKIYATCMVGENKGISRLHKECTYFDKELAIKEFNDYCKKWSHDITKFYAIVEQIKIK